MFKPISWFCSVLQQKLYNFHIAPPCSIVQGGVASTILNGEVSFPQGPMLDILNICKDLDRATFWSENEKVSGLHEIRPNAKCQLQQGSSVVHWQISHRHGQRQGNPSLQSRQQVKHQFNILGTAKPWLRFRGVTWRDLFRFLLTVRVWSMTTIWFIWTN